jgi:methanogenic corrinoid protein MtbC1
MPDQELPPDAAGYVQRILAAAESYRIVDADELCIASREKLPVARMVSEVFGPVLREAGDRWERGEFSIIQEHMLTSAVRRQLHSALDEHNRRAAGPMVAFTTLSGERHELGSLMLAVLASSFGARAIYLGPDLPVAEVGRLCRNADIAAVAVSVVTSAEVIDARGQLREMREVLAAGMPLWVGGPGVAAVPPGELPPDTQFIGDLAQFKQQLITLPGGNEGT